MALKNIPTWRSFLLIVAGTLLIPVNVYKLTKYPKNFDHGNWKDLKEFVQQAKRATNTFIVNDCNTIETIGGALQLNGTGIESIFISTQCPSLTINIKYSKSNLSVSPLPCVALEVNNYKIFSLKGHFYFNNTECIKIAAEIQTSPQDFASELLLYNVDVVSLHLPHAGTIFYAYFKKIQPAIFPHFQLNPYGNYSQIVTQGLKKIIESITVPVNTQLIKRRTTLAYTYLKEEKKQIEIRQVQNKTPSGPFFFLGTFLIILFLCTSGVILTRPCHDKKYREDYISEDNLTPNKNE